MIKIYCDEVYIDQDYYAGIARKGQLYSNVFRLGATLCEEYALTLDAQGITAIPQIVKIYDDEELVKTLIVDSFERNKYEVVLNVKDYMIKANIPYDASPLMEETGQTTLRAILDDICQKMGVKNGVENFVGSDMEVTWYNNQFSARNYLEFIGEINASYMYISGDNTLIMKPIKQEVQHTILFDEVGDYTIGHKHTISRVVWDDTNNKWEFGDTTGETYYINISNVYVISESIVEQIYNAIVGFEYYNAVIEDCPLDNIKVGELIELGNDNGSYPIIAQFPNALTYSGGYWLGGIEIETYSEEQQETKVIDNERIIRNLQTIVDRNNNEIIQIVTETTELGNRVSKNETDINNNQQEIIGKLDELATEEQLIELETSMQTRLDANQLEISNIKTTINDEGVKKVVTTSGTFDENGLTMEKTGAKTKTVLDESGVDVIDTQGTREDLLFAGYVDEERAENNEEFTQYKGQTIVYSKNMIVKNYLTIGTHSRLEDFEDGTGVFYLE